MRHGTVRYDGVIYIFYSMCTHQCYIIIHRYIVAWVHSWAAFHPFIECAGECVCVCVVVLFALTDWTETEAKQTKSNWIGYLGIESNQAEPNRTKSNLNHCCWCCCYFWRWCCCSRSIEYVIERVCVYYCIYRQIYSLQSCHNCCAAHPSYHTKRKEERMRWKTEKKKYESWHHLTPLYPVSLYHKSV